MVLIFVNCLSVGMIALSQISKPITLLLEGVFGETHSHAGILRGMCEESTRDREGFVRHFIKIASSTDKEGGWSIFSDSDVKWVQFVNYSGVKVERRCSLGKGPIDESRATFTINCTMDTAKDYLLNITRDLRHGDMESHNIGMSQGNDNPDSRRVFYLARKMKGVYGPRDFLLEGFEGELEDGSFYIVRRSIFDESLYSMKKSKSSGRTRATVRYEGYLLSQIGDNSVKVIYLENVDFGGLLKGLVMSKVAPKKLRDCIDDILAYVKEKTTNACADALGLTLGPENEASHKKMADVRLRCSQRVEQFKSSSISEFSGQIDGAKIAELRSEEQFKLRKNNQLKGGGRNGGRGGGGRGRGRGGGKGRGFIQKNNIGREQQPIDLASKMPGRGNYEEGEDGGEEIDFDIKNPMRK